MPSLVSITIISLLAHPNLHLSHCGLAAHPTTQHGDHSAPQGLDNNIQFTIYAATQENHGPLPPPYRMADGHTHVADVTQWQSDNAGFALPPGSFMPGAAHHVLVHAPQNFEALVTVSDGSFDDYGRYNTGDSVSDFPGVGCAGQRVISIRNDYIHYHLYLWRAPSVGSSAAFDATIAYESTDPFRRSPMLTLVADSSLASYFSVHSDDDGSSNGGGIWVPPPQNLTNGQQSGESGGGGGFEWKTVAHAWLSVVAFVLAFPLSAFSGRHQWLLPKREDAAESTKRSSSRRSRLLPSCVWWLNAHRFLGWLGCACALSSFLLIEVHKVMGGHGHLHSWHSRIGVGAFGFALLQPLLGTIRPPKTRTSRRTPWLWAHRLCGLCLIGAGTYAVITGVQKCAPHDVFNAGMYETLLYSTLVGVGVCGVLLELLARRRKRDAGLSRSADGAMRAETSKREFTTVTEEALELHDVAMQQGSATRDASDIDPYPVKVTD